MSLILDALKQADSERGRGAPPGVFSQPGVPARAHAARTPRAWMLAVAAGAALLGYLAWPLVPGVARPTPAPAVAEPVPATAPARATTPATASAAPPAAPAALPMPAEAPPAGALFKPPAPEAKAAVAATAPTAPPVASPPPAPAVSPLPPYAMPGPAPAPVQTAAELPADIRAQLPGVNITGHTFSDNPTLRMLMIDGRMFVEGQAVSPGLRVERIGPHQAVFNHRGTRFSVDY
jgi:general secretion pathway protein B